MITLLNVLQFGISPGSDLDRSVVRGLCRDLAECLDSLGSFDVGLCLQQPDRPLEATPCETAEPYPRKPTHVLKGLLELNDRSLQCFAELHGAGDEFHQAFHLELHRGRIGALPEKLLPQVVEALGKTAARSWTAFLRDTGTPDTESHVALCRAIDCPVLDENRLDALETLCSAAPNFLRARVALTTGQLALGLADSARAGLDLLPSAGPQDGHLWALAGRQARMAGRLEAAEARYRKAAVLLPGAAWLDYRLGALGHDLGKLVEARKSLDRAVLGGYESADCLNRLGILLAELDPAAHPVRLWNRALEIDPEFAPAWANLCRAALRRGDAELAGLYIEKAIALWPTFAGFHFNLGVVHQQSDRTEAALASYRKALELQDDFAMAHNNLGVCLKELGREDRAREAFGRALTLDAHGEAGRLARENLDELDRRRLALRHREIFAQLGDEALHGQPGPAIHGLEELLRTHQDFWNAWYALGVAHLRQGEAERAELCLRKVLELKPDQPDARFQLARALLQRGRPAEALEHARRAWRSTGEAAMLQLVTHLAEQAGRPEEHARLAARCRRLGIDSTWSEKKT